MSTARANYRYDLDGIRGIAIAFVVIFHVWVGKVSGGVDVFLALSGFFFVGSLVRGAEHNQGRVDVVRIVIRTLRRLLPTMAVVLAAIGAATLIFSSETTWKDRAEQILASFGYYQNWFLALNSQDYVAADASTSPMQHLWSMSVQGQFYLFAIAGIAVIGLLWRPLTRGRISLRIPVAIVIFAAATASMAWAIRGESQFQAWNYYDTWARLWEILVGAFLAVVAHRLILPLALRWLAGLAGLIMLISCGFLIDGVHHFPGPLAWYPNGAAALLIVAGNVPDGVVTWRRDPLTKLLGTRFFRFFGDVAYALYVWHWPILIFWLEISTSRTVTPLGGAGVIAISLVLAWLTHRFVEEPLRQRGTVDRSQSRLERTKARLRHLAAPRTWLSYRAVAGVLVLALGIATAATAATTINRLNSREVVVGGQVLDAAQFPGARSLTEGVTTTEGVGPEPSILDVGLDLPVSTWDGCISDFNTETLIPCVYGDPNGSKVVAFVGGSHTEHWITAMDDIGKRHGFKVVSLLKMGCVLTTRADNTGILGDQYPGCQPWSDAALAAIETLQPDVIFTTATRPTFDNGDALPQGYVDLWTYLESKGHKTVAIRDTPWMSHADLPDDVPECLGASGSAEACGMPRERVLSPLNPALLATAHLKKLTLMDLSDAICDQEICRAIQGNIIVYHDAHHLSATYVRSLIPAFERQFQTATNWW